MNIFNFIDEYKVDDIICDNFIEYFKKNTEYKSLGSSSTNGFINFGEKIAVFD